MPLACWWFLVISNLLGPTSGNFLAGVAEKSTQSNPDQLLPIDLGIDRDSGCLCRMSKPAYVIMCFGTTVCVKFPKKVKVTTKRFALKKSNVKVIEADDMTNAERVTTLDIEANINLYDIKPGAFRNFSRLEFLSISFNSNLKSLHTRLFEGLINLRFVNLVKNGFDRALDGTQALSTAYVPMLQKLNIGGNSFPIIYEDDFLPMRNSKMAGLDLSQVQLDYIHPKSLLVFKKLRRLRIGENNANATVFTDLITNLTQAKIKVIILHIQGMGFRKAPPRNLLDAIASSYIKVLVFGNNHFEHLDKSMFPCMSRISILDMHKVYAAAIDNGTFDQFPNLTVLLLGGNSLRGISHGLVGPRVKMLDLSSNSGNQFNPSYFEMTPNSWRNMSGLEVLNLSFNRINSLFEYTFEGLNDLKALNLKNGSIFHIARGTFAPLVSLEVLNLEYNMFPLNENLSKSQFEGLAELHVLLLGYCGITHFYETDFFSNFSQLSYLGLQGNRLTVLPSDIFSSLKKLETMDLSNNLFLLWGEPLFKPHNIGLRKLLVGNNKIVGFSQGMLEDINFILGLHGNGSVIDFDGNIISCDCSSFAVPYTWSGSSQTVKVRSFFSTAEFACASPDEWSDKAISRYWASLDNLHCIRYTELAAIKSTIIWASPLIVLLIFLLLLTAFTYYYRSYVRYWMFLARIALGKRYLIKNRFKSASKKKSDAARIFEYDAFVSYSNVDAKFVASLVSKLEDYAPYFKLCVYERDFEVGSVIMESVLNCVNKSRHLILVVSDSFAKSQWCQWETQLAEYHRMFFESDNDYDPLILIKVGELDSSTLSPTLRYLLKTKIYLNWDEKSGDTFWQKLRSVLVKRKG